MSEEHLKNKKMAQKDRTKKVEFFMVGLKLTRDSEQCSVFCVLYHSAVSAPSVVSSAFLCSVV